MKIVDATRAAWQAIKTVYSSSTTRLSAWWQGLTASWGSTSYSKLSQRAYRNPTAARALRLVSQLMASVPFVALVDEEGTMESDHEMVKLLERPNARSSAGFFFSKIVTHLYCGGELFIRRIAPESGPNAGKPTAAGGSLSLISPANFTGFTKDGAGQITGYRFTSGGKTLRLSTDECLHVRIYNPTNEERGMPLLLGAARALEQVEAADDWNKSIAEGGGRIPGYFTPKLEDGKQLSSEQVERAQEQADQATRDRRQKHLPQVLSGAFDYQAASMTLKDADFLQANEANERRIASVIGIPPTLLGDEKSSSLTDAGVDSEVRAAYLLTVLPLVDFVFGELNEWLSDVYGGARLGYDRDQIEALATDVNEMYRRYALAAGGPFISVDEAREANGFEAKGGAYEQIRRVASQDLGAGPIRDGDRDGEAGEGQPREQALPEGARALPQLDTLLAGTGVEESMEDVTAALARRFAQ